MYVVGFVPCSDLPKDLPEYLDPFLKPLMDDLCNGFLSGYNIPYPLQFTSDEFHSSETEIIRLLLLCWTGDHPGQCEVGKFLSQGKCGCRREKLHGQQLQNSSNTHYYYGNNRYHGRYQNSSIYIYICLILEKGTLQHKRVCNKCVSFLWFQY